MKSIKPQEATLLLRGNGATLVDLREPDEHTREHIPGARSLPLSQLDAVALVAPRGQLLFIAAAVPPRP